MSSWQDWGRGLTERGVRELCGDGNVLYFDCGGGYRTVYICLFPSNCTLEVDEFFLPIDCTSIKHFLKRQKIPF